MTCDFVSLGSGVLKAGPVGRRACNSKQRQLIIKLVEHWYCYSKLIGAAVIKSITYCRCPKFGPIANLVRGSNSLRISRIDRDKKNGKYQNFVYFFHSRFAFCSSQEPKDDYHYTIFAGGKSEQKWVQAVFEPGGSGQKQRSADSV
jgi:hypothetical protein